MPVPLALLGVAAPQTVETRPNLCTLSWVNSTTLLVVAIKPELAVRFGSRDDALVY
jgi:hypothetical protein